MSVGCGRRSRSAEALGAKCWCSAWSNPENPKVGTGHVLADVIEQIEVHGLPPYGHKVICAADQWRLNFYAGRMTAFFPAPSVGIGMGDELPAPKCVQGSHPLEMAILRAVSWVQRGNEIFLTWAAFSGLYTGPLKEPKQWRKVLMADFAKKFETKTDVLIDVSWRFLV